MFFVTVSLYRQRAVRGIYSYLSIEDLHPKTAPRFTQDTVKKHIKVQNGDWRSLKTVFYRFAVVMTFQTENS